MSIHKIDGGPGGENNHFPKKFVTLYSADASITAGDWVMIHTTDTTGLALLLRRRLLPPQMVCKASLSLAWQLRRLLL